MRTLYSGSGQPLTLGKELGKGGEASVYELATRSDQVAKIYHAPPQTDKSAKIAAMVPLGSERLLKLAAWPVETLHEKRSGPVIGLVMPKVADCQEIHTLYGPKSRLTHFPDATWPFLIHVAMNVARAFTVIHECGHVIGDVNQSNLLVSKSGTVRLIDCDSFQVNVQGRSYLCEVGVPTHTPPELQGKPFKGTPRTSNHDSFGLAVVIFQLLFMARHPFSGQYLGTGDSSSIEKAITEFRFAYGHNATARQMKQPPATLSLDATSTPVASLFERAFSPEAVRPEGRPRAQEWASALATLRTSLAVCPRNGGHDYLNSLPACPWCEIEAKSGIVLFNVVLVGAAITGTQQTAILDVNLIWSQITAVPAPGPLPSLTKPTVVKPASKVEDAKYERTMRRWVALAVTVTISAITYALAGPFAIIVLIVALIVSNNFANKPLAALRQAIHGEISSAEAHLHSAHNRWTREGKDTEFENKLKELENTRQQLENLSLEKQRRLNQLEYERRQRQLEKYLDTFKVWNANIDGIGPGRVTTLQSYGVETAGDVTKHLIMAIPGFGPSLTYRLMSWRQTHQQRFVFNPREGVNPAEIAKVEQEFTLKRTQLERELLNGPQALQQISQQIQYKRDTLRSGVEQAMLSTAVARANSTAVK